MFICIQVQFTENLQNERFYSHFVNHSVNCNLQLTVHIAERLSPKYNLQNNLWHDSKIFHSENCSVNCIWGKCTWKNCISYCKLYL